ncbi:hypothetical protein [Virgibacillus senegalensis]|nr:hypothetical protein [Virgibacillus senegalensis]
MKETNAITFKGVRESNEKKLVGFRVVCEDMEGYSQEIPKENRCR